MRSSIRKCSNITPSLQTTNKRISNLLYTYPRQSNGTKLGCGARQPMTEYEETKTFSDAQEDYTIGMTEIVIEDNNYLPSVCFEQESIYFHPK